MLPIEKLKSVNHIVTHGPGCSDGLASAMILRQVYPEARVTFVQYGTKELAELPAEPGMLFCDMSPPEARWSEFFDVGAIVLDHHKQIRNVVMHFAEQGLGVFADEVQNPGVSGAVLAFEEVYSAIGQLRENYHRAEENQTSYGNVKRFAYLAGIRDTWQRQSPVWQDACEVAAALRFMGPETCLAAHVLDWPRTEALGKLVVADEARRLKETLEGAYKFTTPAGTRVVMFQGLSATSDAAEQLGGTCDLVVGFGCWQGDDGQLSYVYSTRSHTTFDCGKFCKAMGGGGHTKAAGFREHPSSDKSPWTHFRTCLIWYEDGGAHE